MFSRLFPGFFRRSTIIQKSVYTFSTFQKSLNMPPKRKTKTTTAAPEKTKPENVEQSKAEPVEEVPKKRTKKATKEETPATNGSEKEAQILSDSEVETKPTRTKAAPKKTAAKVNDESKVEKVASKKKAAKEVKNDKEPEEEPKLKKTRGRPAKEPQKEEEIPKEEKKSQGKTTKKEENPKKEVKSKEKVSSKATKKTAEKAEPKKLQNKTSTQWESLDFGCSKKNSEGKAHNLKITSWNVDGIRAWLKKDGLTILKYDNPDVFCLQETKCSEEKLPEDVKIDGYKDYWCSSNKEGYAGVAVYSKKEPLNVSYGIGNDKHDDEGRCITLEYDKFYLVNVYVPNAGHGLVTLPKRLEWNKEFKEYINKLDKRKPVILCGDMNVAHNEIDLTNPKTNKKNAGFTQQERDGMTDFLESGYVDSFRELYPEQEGVYTFWSYMGNARAKHVGWRLDYFILSNRIMKNVCDNVVRSEVFGSDHCPVTLFINI